MTDEEKSTLATQLMLLFDGKDNREIGKILIQTFGLKRAEHVAIALAWDVGISMGVSICPEDIVYEIAERSDPAFGDDYTYELVSPEGLVAACQNYDWGDTGEMFGGARDDVFNACVEDGTIKATPRQESEQ